MWHSLKQQIEVEQQQLRRLLETHASLLAKCRTVEPTADERAALAAILHAFYTGIENLFKRIAVTLDAGLPRGALWHAELIESMSSAGAKRPALLSPSLYEILQEYLDFRHVFRQTYSFELHWEKMKHLVLGLEDVLRRLEQETQAFLQRLHQSENP